MHKINEAELVDIIKSYGLDGLVFDTFKQVEPDTALYIFHDENNMKYCLVAADFLDDNIELPCDFKYDYYPDDVVSFKAVRIFSYVNNAKKKAEGYIDDNHYRTKASTGDVCMLFVIDELKLKSSERTI